MRRHILLSLGLIGLLAAPATAGTFQPAPIAPGLGLDALTRRVAREQLGKQLFGDPWAAVTLSHVDVYDVFPYVESRDFMIVSDPAWNRLVYGEAGQSLKAWNGAGTPFGTLAAPRGLAVDDRDRVYVADAGNGRVLVLQASTEFGTLTLSPVTAIDGLSDPHGLAWSDAGTPFDPADDVLYVADTGRNRVVAFALGGATIRERASVGGLGSGEGRFAGPLALTVTRDAAGVNHVVVADAHNRRLVRLRDAAGALLWQGAVPSGADAITSLSSDEWGNVYAAAPQQGVLLKWSPELEPLATLRDGLTQPRALHIPYVTITDHRAGRVVRAGAPAAIVLEPWGEATGLRRLDLGVSVEGLAVSGTLSPEVSFTLTDPARVTLETRTSTGRVRSRRDVGTLAAGHVSLPLQGDELAGEPDAGALELVVTATANYEHGDVAQARTVFQAAGGSVALPRVASLLPAWPNPASAGTRLRFSLTAADVPGTRFALHDASGRLVRTFNGPFAAGVNDVIWDGLDDAGHPVHSGVYFTRLHAPSARLSRRLVVVR